MEIFFYLCEENIHNIDNYALDISTPLRYNTNQPVSKETDVQTFQESAHFRRSEKDVRPQRLRRDHYGRSGERGGCQQSDHLLPLQRQSDTLRNPLFRGDHTDCRQVVSRTDALDTPHEQLDAYVTTFAEVLNSRPYVASILLRELASGRESMLKSVLEQLLHTTKRLAAILEACAKRHGRHCHEPMVIQLMIISTLPSFLTTEPIRARVREELDPNAPTMPAITLRQLAERVSGMIHASLTEGAPA